MESTNDPYHVTDAAVKEPPATFLKQISFLGPGFILSASIVGSGELIATTILGAKAGFAALWIIIISCFAKVAVQLEFGKHAILTGETAMKAFNSLRGPRIGKGGWAVWIVLLLVFTKIVQLGGILGGTAIVLHILFSWFSITHWALIVGIAVSLLVYNGRYSLIEKISLAMMALFTLLTLASLFSLQFTAFDFSLDEVLSGLTFNLSGAIVGVAIGAFGITGVGSDEIIAYNYWCLEKGYAIYAGNRNDLEAWKRRAEGWIKVMYLDALFSMLVYTIVTVAFYLLGAAILHKLGNVPEGTEVIETLAQIYTRSLGSGARNAYLIGAFFVLFSSLYASLAAWTRLFSDGLGQLGFIDFFNTDQRRRVIIVLSILFPVCWFGAYLFIQLPVWMVLSGGVVGSFLLIIVVWVAIQFKYSKTDAVPAGLIYNIAFWVSIVAILGVAAFGVTRILGGF